MSDVKWVDLDVHTQHYTAAHLASAYMKAATTGDWSEVVREQVKLIANLFETVHRLIGERNALSAKYEPQPEDCRYG